MGSLSRSAWYLKNVDWLRPAPIVIVVPPFAWIDRPALGVHLLQGIARQVGVDVQVVYANLLFAARFGVGSYRTLSTMQYNMWLGERLFARAAYDLPALGRDAGAGLLPRFEALRRSYAAAGVPFELGLDNLARLEAEMPAWVERLARQLAGGPRVLGCTTSFEQNAASLAILGAVKRLAPDTRTILGGANCEGPMAAAVLALTDAVDHVFSGESEATFREFLDGLATGRPMPRIFDGKPCETLDALPTPDYGDYYEQLERLLPDLTPDAHLTYETSRGCWWGEKKHCTFCGLNGQGMASREKSADRAIDELQQLLARHPNRKVALTDNIMPYGYWKTFIPRLAGELPGVDMMYEQKANLTFDQVHALARAGIREIQPGIESLSTGLLRLMDKGTTSAQNVALLRYARTVGMTVQWNLLCGFPGDKLAFYEEMLELVPLLHHLPPPKRVNPIVIDRFSPYHQRPGAYGVRDLRPADGYVEVLPPHADPLAVAYHFQGTFASESLENDTVLRQLSREVEAWRRRYYGAERPELAIVDGPGGVELIDTRGLPGTSPRRRLNEREVIAALVPRKATDAVRREVAWALEARVGVVRDGRYVPLAIAAPARMSELARAVPAAELRTVA